MSVRRTAASLLVMLVALMAGGSHAAGADLWWTTSDGDWFTVANWTDYAFPPQNPNRHRVPAESDRAMLDNGGTARIGTGAAAAMWEEIGVTGYAAVLQSGGSHTAGALVLGNGAGALGTYELQAGDLNATSWICIGFRGQGDFTQFHGTNTVSEELELGEASTGVGHYRLWGGLLSAHEDVIIGNAGRGFFTMGGGTLHITQALQVGISAGSWGSFDMMGGDLHAARFEVGMAGEGSMAIGDAPGPVGPITISADWEDVGINAVGRVTQADGAHTAGALTLGVNAGGTGIYELRGGTLNAASWVCVGYKGTGDFLQSGGTLTVTEELELGEAPTGRGTYDLEAGELMVQEAVLVGSAGRGTFTQWDGNHWIAGGLQLGISAGSRGEYTLLGGDLRTASLGVGLGGEGAFRQTGGTNTVNGALSIATMPSGTGSYTIGGGRLEVEDLDIGSSGEGAFAITDWSAEITVSGTLRFGPGASFSAVPGSTIHVKGLSVQNESARPAALSGLDSATLVFEGGPAVTTSLEAASAPDTGFLANFAFGFLKVGGSAPGHVQLADAFDNGNRQGGKECIYAWSFTIAPNSSVDTKGLRLYECGNDAESLKGAIADGRLRDTTVTGKDRLDAVYDRDNSWTLVAQRLIRDLAGVPEYKWRRGCSPTSAAMIMAYWDQSHSNMWPGTPPSSNDPHSDADPVNVVIEHLGNLMGTFGEGKTFGDMIPGAMTKFAQEKGYSFDAGNKFVSDSPSSGSSGIEGFSFEYLKREIDAARPMLITLMVPAGAHSVAAYGYQDFPGTYDDYIAVMDTGGSAGTPHGHDGVISKVKDGIEWWKWTTDTTQPYYIYMGTFFSPGTSAHEHYGLLESSFQSERDFQEGFNVQAGVSGGASLVPLAIEPQESALRMAAVGSTGPDDCIVSGPVSTPEEFKVSFLYAFETSGTLQILLDGVLLAELADATGVGQVDDSGDFRKFSQEFSLLDYGLDPTLCHEFGLRLLAGSDHVFYVDNLLVYDPWASPVPEPGTLVWTGSVDNRWGLDLTPNWSGGGAAQEYEDRTNVIFDDTVVGSPLLNIAAAVYPGSVLVNNSGVNFEFNGAGSIAGPCGLTKNGTGTLAIATHNTYTGDTRINSGTVIVAAEGALGASTVYLGDTAGSSDAALLVSGAFTVDRNITVQDDGSPSSARTLGGINTSGTAIFSGDITLDKDLTLTAASGGEVELAGALDNSEGNTITKVGEGAVIFDGLQTHGPGALLDILEGTVFLNTDAGSDTTANLSISVADATLYFGCDQHLDVLTIGDDGKVVFAGAHFVVLTHLVMGGVDLGAMTLTPEPATLALLALGGVALMGRRRR